MTVASRRWLIVYDIADDRTRGQVAARILAVGQRVQESKFECRLDPGGLQDLWQDIVAMIDGECDTLHAFPLCASCSAKVQLHGSVATAAVARISVGEGLWIL